jgi:hypothetical protein
LFLRKSLRSRFPALAAKLGGRRVASIFGSVFNLTRRNIPYQLA